MLIQPLHPVREGFPWGSLLAALAEELGVNLNRGLGEDSPARSAAPAQRAMGVRMTGAISPALDRLTRLAGRVLGLDGGVELWVYPGDGMRVEADRSDGKELRLLAASRVFEHASLDEALFLLGRAIGSALLSPSSTMLHNLACDRVGLLCAQDFEAAIRMILREATGLDASLLSSAWDELIASSSEAVPSVLDSLVRQGGTHKASSNDLLRLRIASLSRFARSPDYSAALGATAIDVEDLWTPDLGWPAVARPGSPPSLYHDQSRGSDRTESAPASPSNASTNPPEFQVVYQPIDGDPSVVEQVIRFPPMDKVSEQTPSGSPSPSTRALGEEGSNEAKGLADASTLRRRFCVPAAFWLLGLKEAVSDRQRVVVEDLYGPDVFDEVRPLYAKGGEDAFVHTCREHAPGVAALEASVRFDMLRELCRIAMLEEAHPSPFESALTELTSLLQLAPDDLAMALSEYIDPEYAQYAFAVGESVEVHLDGKWWSGVVETKDQSGEIRVRFEATGEVLRLHPLADMIRPRELRRVG